MLAPTLRLSSLRTIESSISRAMVSVEGAVFASIQDIEAVEFGVEQDGRGAFIWAALAFLVAILLYIVIDHSIGRIAAAGTVALLGVYLVVDQLTTSGRPVVIFKAGSTQLRCDLETEGASEDAYTFINRLFQLKLENGPDGSHRAGRFATALIS